MVDYLIDSEEDVTLLTCKECAFDIYRDLVETGCNFIQSESKILKELNNGSKVIEVTKLVAEGYKEDIYFIFGIENEKSLRDRVIVIDSCIEEYVNKDRIPSDVNVVYVDDIEDEEEDLCAMSSFIKSFLDTEEDEEDCICDECLAISEIMDMKFTSLEEALREAYRFGREAALVEVMENIDTMLYQ